MLAWIFDECREDQIPRPLGRCKIDTPLLAAGYLTVVINRNFDAYTFLNRKEVVSMPEYRRFISYFYEYIDGKKQRNTGFAKVELRNGVWRILFRLTVPIQPDPPVEVFGFMREGKKLTGLPMGTMRAAREMTEEWAYRADEPVWAGKYGLSDISGLWIQSGDGRCFATVWDDEPVDPAQFVRYETQSEEPAGNVESVPELSGNTKSVTEQPEGLKEPAEWSGDKGRISENVEKMPEHQGNEEDKKETAGLLRMEESVPVKQDAVLSETGGGVPERQGDTKNREGLPETGENVREASKQTEGNGNSSAERQQEKDFGDHSPVILETKISPKDLKSEVQPENTEPELRLAENVTGSRDAERQAQVEPEMKETEQDSTAAKAELRQTDTEAENSKEDDRLWRELYGKRAGFQPFSDQEISSCIRVVPGDIVVLQNAHWRTGRNNFLLHGYHNYRHLLIGKSSDGGYVLGVPGIMNPQEKYMASMFGFPNFKYADNMEMDSLFGYWYRPLKRENQ